MIENEYKEKTSIFKNIFTARNVLKSIFVVIIIIESILLITLNIRNPQIYEIEEALSMHILKMMIIVIILLISAIIIYIIEHNTNNKNETIIEEEELIDYIFNNYPKVDLLKSIEKYTKIMILNLY